MKNRNPIPFEIIQLNEDGYHLRIVAKINQTNVSLIVDSGASQTALDSVYILEKHKELEVNTAEQISSGLGTNSMQSYECVFGSFSVGEVVIVNYKAALLDLSHVNHTYKRLNIEPIHGVLGNDILFKFDAIIDYKQKLIFLNTK